MSRAPVAFLLHSFGSAGRSFDAVRAALPVESQAPDLPGFGAAPPLAAPSVAAYRDWTLAQIEALRRPVILVGASMGGKIAMAVAAERPSGLRALILCAPSPPTPEPIEDEERARQLEAWGRRDEAERSVRQATLQPPGGVLFQQAVEDWLRADHDAFDWWWRDGSCERVDVSAAAPGALILAGDQDDHLGPKVQRRTTAAHLTEATVQAVPDSGHLLALDAPHAVAQAIADAARTAQTTAIAG